ncbi:hypothetical protein ACSMXN_09175 [Jatrophihabitans sp. DSM 45814]
MHFHTHSIQWGTGWEAITAVITFGALVAAGFAAKFTFSAARSAAKQTESARTQAKAAQDQLTLARRQVDLAEAEAARLKAESDRANIRLVTSQLDALAPAVIGRARPSSRNKAFFSYASAAGLRDSGYDYGGATFTVPSISRFVDVHPDVMAGEVYAIFVTINFHNYSNVPARIAFITDGHGELDWPGGELYLAPGQSRDIVWKRISASGVEWQKLGEPGIEGQLLDLEYWVRDHGANVRDTYRFNADLRFFERDGSRLIVKPEPAFPWTEAWADPSSRRIYDRLESGASSETAVGIRAAGEVSS